MYGCFTAGQHQARDAQTQAGPRTKIVAHHCMTTSIRTSSMRLTDAHIIAISKGMMQTTDLHFSEENDY